MIFFDVPMPGSPRLLRDWRVWVEAVARQWHRLWTNDHSGIGRSLRWFSCRLLWSALLQFRRFLVPIENTAMVRRLLQWSQSDNCPLYKVRPLDAPFLHILSTEEPGENEDREFDPNSRFGWRSIARGGIEERFVALDHYNILHESNLPVVAETLLGWCGVSESIRDLDAHSTAERTLQ